MVTLYARKPRHAAGWATPLHGYCDQQVTEWGRWTALSFTFFTALQYSPGPEVATPCMVL